MPVYEFECRDCMTTYNKEIDKLVKNLNKKYAEGLSKKIRILNTLNYLILKQKRLYFPLVKKATRELGVLDIN